MSLAAPQPEKPTSGDVAQGKLLWLSTWKAFKASQTHRGIPISRPSQFTIHFLTITSFGGKTLSQRFPAKAHNSVRRQLGYVPIAPTDRHPLAHLSRDHLYDMLHLQNGGQLTKGSYMNVREVYEMDWRDAELCWAPGKTAQGRFSLDSASLGRVLALLSFRGIFRAEGQWHQESVAVLWVQRLWALVSAQAKRLRALMGRR
ncbi:unnamed protein product [Zymoseptoria tritici ST99CH_3D1]|nr:unnamed protein product [Zymoseptoria tritici ST99CH_3D1]